MNNTAKEATQVHCYQAFLALQAEKDLIRRTAVSINATPHKVKRIGRWIRSCDESQQQLVLGNQYTASHVLQDVTSNYKHLVKLGALVPAFKDNAVY
jgi:hypothetical protein